MSLAGRGVADVAASLTVGAVRAAGRGKPTVVFLFRWFVGVGLDDAASVFSKNRNRLLEGDIAAKFLVAVLAQPKVNKLLSTDNFSVDGTLIEAGRR
ncbi:hypothetical protein X731_29755 [Mesorhizobium sp. L2C054A000]|nr:hypothetical protein X731_29755 [Mesorhizobium sp. L2C054A000]